MDNPNRHLVGAGCVVLTLLMCGLVRGSAAAQTVAAPETAARVNAGPFHVSPTLRLQNLGVDSNVYNVGKAVSDFTFTATPEINVRAGTAGTRITLQSVTDFVYFAQHGSERSVNQSLNGSGQARLRRLIVVGNAGYLTTRQRPTAEIDARSRRIEYNGHGSIGVQVSSKLSALVGGRYAKTSFDADAIFDDTYLARQLNRDARAATVELHYAATPITTIVASGDVTRTRFARSPVRDSDSHGVYGGVEFNPRALISGAASVGYQRFTPLNPTIPAFDGLVGSVGLRYRLLRLTSVGLTLDRHVEYSYSEQQPYFVQQAYGLSFQRQLNARLSVEASASRARYMYRRKTTDGGAIDSIADRQMRLLDVGVGAEYRTAPNTVVKCVVQHRDRDSDFANRSYSGVRVMTSVAYGF